MVSCAQRSCKSRRNVHQKQSTGITFHRFPRDPAGQKLWLEFVKRGAWKPNKYSVLCSKHFSNECFDRTSQCHVRVKKGSIPTIDSSEVHFEESQFERNRQDRWKKLNPNAVPTLFNMPNPPSTIHPPLHKSVFKNKIGHFKQENINQDIHQLNEKTQGNDNVFYSTPNKTDNSDTLLPEKEVLKESSNPVSLLMNNSQQTFENQEVVIKSNRYSEKLSTGTAKNKSPICNATDTTKLVDPTSTYLQHSKLPIIVSVESIPATSKNCTNQHLLSTTDNVHESKLPDDQKAKVFLSSLPKPETIKQIDAQVAAPTRFSDPGGLKDIPLLRQPHPSSKYINNIPRSLGNISVAALEDPRIAKRYLTMAKRILLRQVKEIQQLNRSNNALEVKLDTLRSLHTMAKKTNKYPSNKNETITVLVNI